MANIWLTYFLRELYGLVYTSWLKVHEQLSEETWYVDPLPSSSPLLEVFCDACWH